MIILGTEAFIWKCDCNKCNSIHVIFISPFNLNLLDDDSYKIMLDTANIKDTMDGPSTGLYLMVKALASW